MTDSTHPNMPKSEEQRQLQDRRLQNNTAQAGEFDEELGVMVLERDQSGFARITESVPGVDRFGNPSRFDVRVRNVAGFGNNAEAVIDEDHPHASQKLPDNLADQVPTGDVPDVGRLLHDSVSTGQKLATSADDEQQPANPPHQPRSFPTQPVATPSNPATANKGQTPASTSPVAPTASGTAPVAAAPTTVEKK